MKNSRVESYQILDLSILKQVNEFIDDTNWYTVCANNYNTPMFKPFFDKFPIEQQTAIQNRTDFAWPLISKINPNGLWPGQTLNELGEIPLDQIVKTFSIIRQPYGWNESSTARRAPVIYNFFQYINNEFFNNNLTLAGEPEEISGARHLWYDENEKELPNWGKDIGPTGSRYDERDPLEVWTAYANAKTPTSWNLLSTARRIAKLPNRTISNGAHRDWHGMYGDDETDIENSYTMVIPVNEVWKYGEGLELILYDTIPPGPDVSVHDRRGYGVGEPTHIFPHKPGLIAMYPASTIHTTTAPGTLINNSVLGKNVVFRVKKKTP